jgi:dynein intermediate chain 2, axonemal
MILFFVFLSFAIYFFPLQISDHSIKCVKPHESGRMIACGCANGSVHLMEVSENMTFSAKNDKAILNAVSKTERR